MLAKFGRLGGGGIFSEDQNYCSVKLGRLVYFLLFAAQLRFFSVLSPAFKVWFILLSAVLATTLSSPPPLRSAAGHWPSTLVETFISQRDAER